MNLLQRNKQHLDGLYLRSVYGNKQKQKITTSAVPAYAGTFQMWTPPSNHGQLRQNLPRCCQPSNLGELEVG